MISHPPLDYAPLTHLNLCQQIGRIIKQRRRQKRFTQTELASRCDTTQTAIARLELGLGNPTLGLVDRVARALDLDLNIRIF